MILPDSSADARTPDDMPAAMRESQSIAFGEFLRHAREDRGLSLQHISNETKIPCRHLDALEHGNWAAIPGGMYRRAEVRAYARVIQLDQNLALAELERALEALAPRPAVAEIQPPHSRTLSSAYARVAIGVVGVAVAMSLAIWAGPGPLNAGVQALSASASRETQVEAPAPVGDVRTLDAAPSIQPQNDAPAPQTALSASVVDPERPPVRPADPPPADWEGSLEVITEPAGARVTVNGIGWGSAPVTIRHLSAGDQRVRVTMDGYASEERIVGVVTGRPTRKLRVSLRATP